MLAFCLSLVLSLPLVGAQFTDTCAVVNTELVVPDLLGILTAVGIVDSCLCQDQVPGKNAFFFLP